MQPNRQLTISDDGPRDQSLKGNVTALLKHMEGMNLDGPAGVVVNAFGQFGGRVMRFYDDLNNEIDPAVKVIRETVAQQPVLTVSLAFVVGIVIGRMRV